MYGSSLKSRFSLRRWLTVTAGLFLLFNFNNCGTYQDVDPGSLMSLYSIDCPDSDCITPVMDNLSVRPILPGGVSSLGIQGGLAEFNVGGDCNEGGYPLNVIKWELLLNGNRVRHSGMAGMISMNPYVNVNSRCINGRFLIYVNLAPIPEDPVNRAGLVGPGGPRYPYDLYVEICGQNSTVDVPQCNPVRARTRIMLLAI